MQVFGVKKTDFNNVAFTGSIGEEVYNLTGTVLDPTNGTIQVKALAGSTTFTESIGVGEYIVLHLTYGSSAVVIWPVGISWVGGVAPALASATSSATDVIVIHRLDSNILVGSYIGVTS